MVDRPTPDVASVLAEFKIPTIEAPHPLLVPGKERFMEALNLHLRELEECDPDWVMTQDDDQWLEPRKAELLPSALADRDVDAYFLRTLFFQDQADTYNSRRQHYSIQLWRHIKGFRYTTKRILFCPDALHDSAVISCRTRALPAPLLDYGGFTEAERQATYKAYEKAGKIDPFTRALVEPPALQKFPKDFDANYGPFTDLWTAHSH